MKKLLCLFIIIILCFCGCTADKAPDAELTTGDEAEEVSYVRKVLEENKNYTVINNGDFTYTYEIRDAKGTMLLYESQCEREPHIEMLSENLLKCMIQFGTGISTQITFYVNVETGVISEDFISVFDEYNGRTAYHLYQNSKHYMIVRDIFDKDAYYKEFEIKDDIFAIADAVVSAEFSENGKTLDIVYLAGEDYDKTEMSFDIE